MSLCGLNCPSIHKDDKMSSQHTLRHKPNEMGATNNESCRWQACSEGSRFVQSSRYIVFPHWPSRSTRPIGTFERVAYQEANWDWPVVYDSRSIPRRDAFRGFTSLIAGVYPNYVGSVACMVGLYFFLLLSLKFMPFSRFCDKTLGFRPRACWGRCDLFVDRSRS